MSESEYEISADPARLDLDVVHGFLTEAYWSRGVSRAMVARAVAGSLCFGAYQAGRQVGFARVVSDQATFAHLCDVFVLPDHRGRRLGHRLIQAALDDPRLVGVRRWQLNTEDAHELYRQFGFGPPAKPHWLMVRSGGAP